MANILLLEISQSIFSFVGGSNFYQCIEMGIPWPLLIDTGINEEPLIEYAFPISQRRIIEKLQDE